MKKSPLYPKYEHQDNCGYDFDPHTDFAQFFSEARKHARKEILGATPPHLEESGEKKVDAEKKLRNPSCKRSLFSWFKREKKNKNGEEASRNSHGATISKPGCDFVSGPIRGSGGCAVARPRNPLSGPITSLFNGINQEENEVPYMCLKKMNSPMGVQSYGPVYFVT